MQDAGWKTFFKGEIGKPYTVQLKAFLDAEYATQTIYPDRKAMYAAFDDTPLNQVKVVIVGQDPYHNPDQAHGLSFSVQDGVSLPPSLINIYKEIESDLKVKMNYSSGNLTYLARQGVLLLNSILTVRAGQPLSHDIPEYRVFFEEVLRRLSLQNQPIVFMLWGSFAKRFKPLLTNPKHLILEAHHPSPLSANRGGWFGTRVFSKANAFLEQCGVKPIQWSNE